MTLRRETASEGVGRPHLVVRHPDPVAIDSRRYLLRRALSARGVDALVCTLPANVLMVTGARFDSGTSVAVATRSGRIALLASRVHEALARTGWADEIRLFEVADRDEADVIAPLLRRTLYDLGVDNGDLACESADSVHLAPRDLVDRAHDAYLTSECDELFDALRRTKSPEEVRKIRFASELAERVFARGRQAITPGLRDEDVAAAFRAALINLRADADGLVSCQIHAGSGERISGRVRGDDFVTLECAAQVDGYWTHAARTYHVGPLDEDQRQMYGTILTARYQALSTVRPGVAAAAVDSAAQTALARGGGSANRHATGHNVGFCSARAEHRPLLASDSTQVLETGMVFTVEIGAGALRHVDVVVVNSLGHALLTPFHSRLDELVIS